jgi:hypothetical protein
MCFGITPVSAMLAREVITFRRVNSDLLISILVVVNPPVSLLLSLPARSTNYSLLENTVPSISIVSSETVNIE